MIKLHPNQPIYPTLWPLPRIPRQALSIGTLEELNEWWIQALAGWCAIQSRGSVGGVPEDKIRAGDGTQRGPKVHPRRWPSNPSLCAVTLLSVQHDLLAYDHNSTDLVTTLSDPLKYTELGA